MRIPFHRGGRWPRDTMNYHEYQLIPLGSHRDQGCQPRDLSATTPLTAQQMWLFLPRQHLSLHSPPGNNGQCRTGGAHRESYLLFFSGWGNEGPGKTLVKVTQDSQSEEGVKDLLCARRCAQTDTKRQRPQEAPNRLASTKWLTKGLHHLLSPPWGERLFLPTASSHQPGRIIQHRGLCHPAPLPGPLARLPQLCLETECKLMES